MHCTCFGRLYRPETSVKHRVEGLAVDVLQQRRWPLRSDVILFLMTLYLPGYLVWTFDF